MTSGRADRRLWLPVLGLGLVIGLARAAWAMAFLGLPAYPEMRPHFVFNNVVFWVSAAALCLGVIALGRAIPISGPRRGRAAAAHVVFSLVFPFVHLKIWSFFVTAWLSLHGLARFTLAGLLTERDSLNYLSQRFQWEWEITLYWGVLGLAHALLYRDDSRERAVAAARLDAELARAQLDALQRQMQPHFLFNTLQSVTALMHRDVTAAEQMLERLSVLLRGMLRTSALSTIPLHQELLYVDHYLAIEQVNLGDRLTSSRDIDADVLDARVPPLLLQPLIENAIRHAIARHRDGGHLRFSVARDGAHLRVVVTDTGPGAPGSEGAGLALENIRRRLALLYPGRHEFTIGPRPDHEGTEVQVRIPYETGAPI